MKAMISKKLHLIPARIGSQFKICQAPPTRIQKCSSEEINTQKSTCTSQSVSQEKEQLPIATNLMVQNRRSCLRQITTMQSKMLPTKLVMLSTMMKTCLKSSFFRLLLFLRMIKRSWWRRAEHLSPIRDCYMNLSRGRQWANINRGCILFSVTT